MAFNPKDQNQKQQQPNLQGGKTNQQQRPQQGGTTANTGKPQHGGGLSGGAGSDSSIRDRKK